MRFLLRSVVIMIIVLCVILGMGCQKKDLKETHRVIMTTTMGEIEIELYPDKAPVSVENFLSYVRSGFYDNTVFHRVINGFMIQGGGYDKEYTAKEEKNPPIVNEAANGLSNKRGAIAYARTNVINSATSQFFINHVDNLRLDHKDSTATGFGYAVFGKVVRGMEVVDKVANVQTDVKPMTVFYEGEWIQQAAKDVPTEPVLVKSVRIVME